MTPKEFRTARYERRKSQQVVANATGVNKAYISEWEQGVRVLSAFSVGRLETYYREVLRSPPFCPNCGHILEMPDAH